MSRFSDYCKYLIKENGTNVHQISKNTTLDCTTLQRMVTGKRVPSREFVEKFCSYLRISETEKKGLIELFLIEQLGETSYYSYKYIKEMFCQLYNLEQNPNESSFQIDFSQTFINPLAYQKISISVENLIFSILSECFHKPHKTHIYTNLPSGSNFLRNVEIMVNKNKNKVHIMHLIYFYLNGIDNLSNLTSLLTVLPYALSPYLDYNPYFIYTHLNYAEFQNTMFPFYLITDQKVLLLSGDLQNCVIIDDPTQIQQYIEQFHLSIQQSHVLIHKTDILSEAFTFYSNALPEKKTSFYGIEYQLCFTNLFKKEDFHQVVQTLMPNLRSSIPLIDSLFTLEKEFFYTKEGIDSFFQSGKFYGQAATILPPLSKPYIINIFEQYLHSKQSDHCHMIKDSIHMPRYINFEINENPQLNIIQIIDSSVFQLLTIEEPTICDAFNNFFNILQNSEEIYSVDESKSYIKKKINDLKKSF